MGKNQGKLKDFRNQMRSGKILKKIKNTGKKKKITTQQFVETEERTDYLQEFVTQRMIWNILSQSGENSLETEQRAGKQIANRQVKIFGRPE